MTSQGPPLRFKAVNTETGIVADVTFFDFQNMTMGIKVKDSHWVVDIGLKWNPRQSTGLHDAKGREIYAGDIVWYKNKLNEIQWAGSGWYVGNWVPGELEDTAEDIWVVGNRHESRETLEARAREVIGGA